MKEPVLILFDSDRIPAGYTCGGRNGPATAKWVENKVTRISIGANEFHTYFYGFCGWMWIVPVLLAKQYVGWISFSARYC